MATTRGGRWRAVVAAAALVVVARTASADERHDRAAAAFDEGERAFAAGAYERAASSFEQAHAIAPHTSALVNAAKARLRAGDRARAAALYARILRMPEDGAAARDRDEARAALAGLEPSLGRITVRAEDATVDGAPVETGGVHYVAPGMHEVRGRVGGRTVTKTVHVDGGASLDETLSTIDVPAASPRSETTEASSGLPRVVTYVLGGATIVGAGITVWSGLDVLAQKRAFDQTGSDADLDEGFARQRRTNVLLATTGGLAVLTVVAALFTTWSSPRPTARLPPSAALVW